MENITIKELSKKSEIPYDLLNISDPSIESINEYVDRGICYVAYKNGIIIGIYILIKTRPLTLELVNISVEESYQGAAIGKQLLYSAINISKKSNAKVLEVGTGNSSISQLAFYQKCGFRIASVDKDYFKKYYKEKIIENGIECIDMIRLNIDL